ncbi:MAG TPA: hypothetical protein VMA97_05715, partial [Streptosporangiaceae bacterium]|nr:hypothetical protein [Streptosporangiaceae bacterium]
MTTTRAAEQAEVLAVLGRGAEGPVTQTAEVIARLAGGQVRPLCLAADLSPGRAARRVIRALDQPGTVTGVLPGDERSPPSLRPRSGSPAAAPNWWCCTSLTPRPSRSSGTSTPTPGRRGSRSSWPATARCPGPVSVDLGAALVPPRQCPSCGSGHLVPDPGEEPAFRCSSCDQYWQIELG